MQSRRFAAIMFTDIVGYTALMGTDEQKAFSLLRQNRQIHKKLIKKYKGTWLKEMGDGILASFKTASNAVLCAAEIQVQAKNGQIGLRIGIHAGEVVFEGRDVLGDGVNVASRLEMLADEGQICVSATIYNNIKNKSGFQTEYLGEKQLKNVADPVKVYQIKVNAEDFGEGLINLHEKKEGNNRLTMVAIGLLVVVVIALVGILLAGKLKRDESAEMGKSIAVLQFRNLSGEEENQYFAAGVMEAINNHLSGVKNLRVSTRTATEKYLNTDKPIQEIGKELEVTHILEGSVQKFEDQLRISTRIIDVRNDRQIWTKQYTEPLQDIFDLMTRIAMDVTSELRISLTPREQLLLSDRSSTDITAYDLYLRGRNYFDIFISMQKKDDLLRAKGLYREAIKIDSTFALAWVGLGEVCDQQHNFYNHIPKYKVAYEDSIMMYTSKAISLDPYLADAYALRGLCYSYTNEIDRAISDQEMAISLNPNLAESYLNLGIIWMNKKNDPVKTYRYLKTAQYYERNGSRLLEILWHLGTTEMMVEDFTASERYFRQMIQLLPENPAVNGTITWLLWSQGKFEEALAFEDSMGFSKDDNGLLHYFMGNFDKAIKSYEKPDVNDWDDAVESDSLLSTDLANMYLKSGNTEKGMDMLEQIIARLISAENKNYWGLAEAYAVLGENGKAVDYLLKEEEERPYNFLFSFMPHYHVFTEVCRDPAMIEMIDRVEKRKAEARRKLQDLEKSGKGMLVAGL